MAELRGRGKLPGVEVERSHIMVSVAGVMSAEKMAFLRSQSGVFALCSAGATLISLISLVCELLLYHSSAPPPPPPPRPFACHPLSWCCLIFGGCFVLLVVSTEMSTGIRRRSLDCISGVQKLVDHVYPQARTRHPEGPARRAARNVQTIRSFS